MAIRRSRKFHECNLIGAELILNVKVTSSLTWNSPELTRGLWKVLRSEGIKTLTPKSVIKKLKSKGFAAKVERDEVYKGAELFEVDLTTIPDFYHKVPNKKNETTIEVEAFSKKKYKPTQYSFWEEITLANPVFY